VILLDHHLLDVSSLEVLEQLRAYEPVYHIPVMLLSGLAHQLAGVDHGADRILSKPFDITDLLGQLYSLANDARVIDS
jgi:DNA-binding response OmpR family regulator